MQLLVAQCNAYFNDLIYREQVFVLLIEYAEWFEWTVQVIIPVIDNFLLEKIEGYMLG